MGVPDASVPVRSVMTPEVVACAGTATIGDVAKILATRRVHALFVLDDRRRPLGVVSDVDLLTGEWLGTAEKDLAAMRAITAGELMSTPVETIEATAPVARAARRMQELRIARLLVCDQGGVAVGVLSVTDLVARLARYPTERRFVGDVMSHAIVTCRPEAPRQAVLRSMVYRRSRSVVVVEGDRPVGVVTGRDALRLYEGSETPKEGSAGDFMRAPVITATPELPLREAAERMLDHEIHRLVVVDRASGKGPLGVISTSDVVAEMSAEGSVWQPDVTARR